MRSRALLRLLLSSYLDLEPLEVSITADAAGRPYIDGPSGPDFSISHSGGLALYALAADGRVGVDVELDRSAAQLSVLGRRLARSGGPRELLADWTRREAVLKCCGAHPWLQELDLGTGGVATLAATGRPTRVRLWTLDASRDAPLDSPHAERRGRPTGAPMKIPARGCRP
jgi:hypothetical protein